MKKLKNKIGFILLASVSLWLFPVRAQMFGDGMETQSSSWGKSSVSSAKTSWWGNKTSKSSDKEKTDSAKNTNSQTKNQTNEPKGPPAKVDVENPEDYIYKAMPRKLRPTLDGVKRGTTSIYPIAYNGMQKAEDEPLIFLLYSDFSVNKLLSGTVTCNVRFQIITTLDRKLTNLSIRLRWPEMETSLSFIDVPPNQMVHHDYTLIGDGCYSMDKIPNIIVNRCRVKGLSQKDCAAKIRWLKK